FHFFKGTYLSYASPKLSKMGKSIFLIAPFDKATRRTAKKYLLSCLKNPLNIFRRLHLQTIMFIQPVDFGIDGEQNMCDGCPDITVWNDKLVWSCRLEEQKQFGTFLKSVPQK
ncbi:MAG: radical SAM protein, partial [Ignavibacteriales bacterium CG12_big_fil_rev_8_21_14_0_65_30_8]